MSKEEYYLKHKACPVCNNINLMETYVGYIYYEDKEFKDENMAQCKCGWEGLVHNLVKKGKKDMKTTVKVKKIIEKDIEKCFYDCPYLGEDGWPGPVMVCEHPKAPDSGYIVGHPACDNGFPVRCPLLKENR